MRLHSRLAAVATCIGVPGLIAGTLLAPQFRVKTITIEGSDERTKTEAETIARTFLAREASVFGSARTFLVPRERLAAELTSLLPHIASARVVRRLPGTVEIRIQEKVAVAYLNQDSALYAMDGAGRIIAQATAEEAATSGLPRVRNIQATSPVRLGDDVLNEEVIALLHDVVVLLPERVNASIREFLVPAVGTEEVHVRTDRGWTLLLDAKRPFADQLAVLEKILTEELNPKALERLEYMDLRVPGKVFYRLRSGMSP